jgi:hypothetical protein
VDARPVLFRFHLCVAGGRACSGNAVGDVVGGRNQAKPVCTKTAIAKFKLRHYMRREHTDCKGGVDLQKR